MYQKLFRKYPPQNTEIIKEYQTYIELADTYQVPFGGKSSLKKMIPLVAPNWKYNKYDGKLIKLYRKYGIDSLELEKEIRQWEERLNKQLVDSFSVAVLRDQAEGRRNAILRNKNDRKNAELISWTFDHFGYPSQQKIGLWGNNGTFLSLMALINHTANSPQFEYISSKLFEYVKSGDCPPEIYAGLIDKNQGLTGGKSIYGELNFSGEPLDTVAIDRNRTRIGLPSINHQKRIYDDAKNK